MHDDCLVCERCITKDEDIPTCLPLAHRERGFAEGVLFQHERSAEYGCQQQVPTLHPYRRPKSGRRKEIDDQSDIIRLNPKGDG